MLRHLKHLVEQRDKEMAHYKAVEHVLIQALWSALKTPEDERNAKDRVLESFLEETLLNLSLKDIDKLARWVQGNEVLGREKILYLYRAFNSPEYLMLCIRIVFSLE